MLFLLSPTSPHRLPNVLLAVAVTAMMATTATADAAEASEASEGATAAEDGDETPSTAEPSNPASPANEPEAEPAPIEGLSDEAGVSGSSEPSSSPLASVARIVSGSRVGGGVLIAPDLVATLLDRVGLGYLVDVQLGAGHRSIGRISKVDRARGLALVQLDDPAPTEAVAILAELSPELGEAVTVIGHGGSVGLSLEDAELKGLISFSSLQAHVAAAAYEQPADFEGAWATNFLLDRTAGAGDEGCPVFSASGELVGILRRAVPGSGGRGLVAATSDLRALNASPEPEKAYRRPHHMQSWGGSGVAFHNRPNHIAGLVTMGLRIAFLDALRLEPWFEVDLGTRAATQTPAARPRDFWWSVETGLSFGYRLPLFSEGKRSYVVPTAGLRLGWNRFQHSEQALASSCLDGDCSWIVQKTTDQERSFRAGVDVGVDVRHGKVRLGYRYFLSPADLKGHAMHRIVMTIDGWPIPIGLGDTH